MSIADRLGAQASSLVQEPKVPNFTRGAVAPAEEPKSRPVPHGTKAPRPNAYPGKCTECGGWVEAGAGLLTKDADGKWAAKHEHCPKAAPKGETQALALDLSTLPAGAYAVPDGSRLKVAIEKPEEGKWVGWTFVKNATEYGEGAGARFGSQRPGGTYKGQIETQLAIILENPREAAAEYGRITKSCGLCGRKLETPESVARGIGPECAKKHFGG